MVSVAAMVIKQKSINGMQVLSLIGKLDIFSKNSFNETIAYHREQGIKGLILDLRGVTFIDSVGIGALVSAAKTFKQMKGKVVLVNPQETVKQILEQMNIIQLIPIFTADETYSSFSTLS
ncbi:MAG: anti-sigma factor antagonist [Nitrospirales bacterium]|nr:MAG: anti-sigma factor antagonist [Nitrospirales bacterium]